MSKARQSERTPWVVYLIRVSAVTAFGLALLLALLPGEASASTPVKSGWWDMTPAGQGPPVTTTVPSAVPTTLPSVPTTAPAPTPTTVPVVSTLPATPSKGSLEVGYDGHDSSAIAALEYVVPLNAGGGLTIAPGSIQAVVTLTVAKTASAGSPVLLACPTTSSWSAGAAQSAKKAPKYNCSGRHAAAGRYNSSSGVVTFTLTSQQESTSQPGVFSIAIVPAKKLKPTQAFSTTFAKPDNTSFQLLAWNPASGGSGSGSGVGSGYPGPSPLPSPSPVPSGVGGSSGGSSYGFTPPSAGGSSSAGSGATNPGGSSASPAPSASTPVPRYSLGPSRLASHKGFSSQDQRNLAIGILAALGIGLAAMSGRNGRRPRLLIPIPAPVSRLRGLAHD